ncbi:MAG: hypothetical protein LQ350_001096 [Teloschistes chrysophthalmus]|nr:MAG: hypothetical protein LQ350_001096 [Niorma chrysophthalma]
MPDSTQDSSEKKPGKKEKRDPKNSDIQKSGAPQSTVNGTTDVPQKATDQKDEKISGAELKKRHKAEKAAKRAQAKQEQQNIPEEQAKNGKADAVNDRDHNLHATGNTAIENPQQSSDICSLGCIFNEMLIWVSQGQSADKFLELQREKGSILQPLKLPVPIPQKGKHQRKGSTTANIQKPLQIRPSQQPAPAPVPEPRKSEAKKVAFLSHLYGAPRRTTIAGAHKDIHPSVLALGLQMSNYVVCGSNARCVSTLLAFKKVINAYTTPPGTSLPRHLALHLSTQIDYLVSCRPLSISMGNAIRWLKLAISTIDPDTAESQAKAELCIAIDNFIRERITVAGQAIATSACSRIQDGDVILTFAKSSIVERTLVEAYKQGKKFRVIVVDSRPLHEGRNLALALANMGLEVQYALTHTLSHVVRDATKVFLGAHGMMSNGRLYSRVGTAMVAMMAKETDIPVIVLCESVKFTDRVALDSISFNEVAPPEELGSSMTKSSNEGSSDTKSDPLILQALNLMYDLTPADFINMVITEYGSIPPSSVPVVHRLSTNT